jgi:ribonuclease P protein component
VGYVVAMTTIKSSREIEEIFHEGRREASRELFVLARRTPSGRGQLGRVAFIAGKKLGNAVTRNRCKRLLRQAAREAGGPWRGWDVLVMARPSIMIEKPATLGHGIQLLLRKAGIQ